MVCTQSRRESQVPKPIFKLRPELLLYPNTPKPLHGTVPREIYGKTWWDQTRKAAYKSTNYHCAACGIPKEKAKYVQWLEGHELYDIDYRRGRMTYIETVPLCHFCHNYIHDGRMQWLLSEGRMTQNKYVSIIQHGDAILDLYGLPSEVLYQGPTPNWSEWRLILDGKEYEPKFRSYEAWARNWGR